MDSTYVSGPISKNVRKLEPFKTGSDRPGVNRGSSMLMVSLSHTTVSGTGTGKEGPCLSSQDGFCGCSGSTVPCADVGCVGTVGHEIASQEKRDAHEMGLIGRCKQRENHTGGCAGGRQLAETTCLMSDATG
jgi:hypothetical protein